MKRSTGFLTRILAAVLSACSSYGGGIGTGRLRRDVNQVDVLEGRNLALDILLLIYEGILTPPHLDHEEFKSKLPMLLQFEDITDAMAGDFKDSFYPAGVQALMSQGRSCG